MPKSEVKKDLGQALKLFTFDFSFSGKLDLRHPPSTAFFGGFLPQLITFYKNLS